MSPTSERRSRPGDIQRVLGDAREDLVERQPISFPLFGRDRVAFPNWDRRNIGVTRLTHRDTEVGVGKAGIEVVGEAFPGPQANLVADGVVDRVATDPALVGRFPFHGRNQAPHTVKNGGFSA